MASNPLTSLYLHPGQAATILGVQPRTLARWRSEGSGPKYYKFGRQIRYLLPDLSEWIASKGIIPPRGGGAAH